MLTPKALAVLLVCAGGLLGCNREQEAVEKSPQTAVSPTAPESYMNDPVFMAKVEAQDKAQRKVLKQVAELKKQYEAAVAAKAEAAVLKRIQSEIDDLGRKFLKIRQQTQAIVGERLRGKTSEKGK